MSVCVSVCVSAGVCLCVCGVGAAGDHQVYHLLFLQAFMEHSLEPDTVLGKFRFKKNP